MSEQHKELGVNAWRASMQVAGTVAPPPLVHPPRVIVTPLLPPLVHPLSKRDVQLVISLLPPSSTAGLRSVSLLDPRVLHDGTVVLASYRREGFLRLHAVTALPWELHAPAPALLEELHRYGARLDAAADETIRVIWTSEALRLFYVMGVLLPGVARHRREQNVAPEANLNVRCLAPLGEALRATPEAIRQWRQLLRRGEDF